MEVVVLASRQLCPTSRAAILGIALAVGVCTPALAFQCPTPQPLARPGVLKESSARIARVSALLATGDRGNHLPAIVSDLRGRYPKVQNAEIMNYLVTAYCPDVSRLTGLSDGEKQSRMRSFVAQASNAVFSAGSRGLAH